MSSRRNNAAWLIPLLLAAGAAAALAYYWYSIPRPPPAPAPAETPGEVTEERRPPGPIHPLEPLGPGVRSERELVPLPSLNDSDAWFRLELVNLFGKGLDNLLANDLVIERVVATIDNLPRSHVAERMRPVGRLSSNLVADAADDDGYVLSGANYERYTWLVDMLTQADLDEVEDAYRRYYPLLQEAYVALGYPNGHFNDRVVEVIDHLLATPDVQEPIRLVRPHVLYEYADPKIEALSSGQKLMIRMGPAHATRIKDGLADLRARISRQ